MAVRVTGSINVDVIARVDALPRPGETVMAQATHRSPGGKGANQAVAAARMGATTAMAGAVGDDGDGRWMLAALADAGVDVGAVATVDGVATGAAYISVDARGENMIVVAPGANARLVPDNAGSGSEGDVALAQLEVPVETLAAMFAGHARLRMLNAAPAVIAAKTLFPAVDVLIVNQHELACYAGGEAVTGVDVAVVRARTLLTRAGQVAIVTLGAGGAVAVWADRHFHAPALPVTPVDTVGAGDCFCGALAALLDERLTIEDALPLANAAAALCTQAAGAVPAMPMRAAVERAATDHARAVKNAATTVVG